MMGTELVIYIESNDATVTHKGAATDPYATVHNAANATEGINLGTSYFIVRQSRSTGMEDPYYHIGRSCLQFNTSALEGKGIVSVTLSLRMKDNVSNFAATNFDVVLVDGSNLAATPEAADYGVLLSEVITLASKNTADMPETGDAWHDFPLNVTGIALINKTGITKFGLRSSRDINSQPPTVGAESEWAAFYSYDGGVGYRPYITVAYYNESYPSDAITRATNIIHRYVRAVQAYTMEVNFGEVTSDFGLPEWAEKAMVAYVPEADKPATAGDVDKAIYDPLREYMNRPPPSSVMITETTLTPPLTEPFTSIGATAADMAKYAGMGQAEYDKIIRENKIQKALKEFGPLTGPEDLVRFKAKYPSLQIGLGTPNLSDSNYVARMGLLGAAAKTTGDYDANMRLLAKNAPHLLTPEELKKYG